LQEVPCDMQNTYNYILFDLDGTLTDSAKGIIKSIQYSLKQFNIEAKPEELLSFLGPPLHLSFMDNYNFNSEESFVAVKYYRSYYAQKGIFENKLYPGILPLLKLLKTERKRLFIATSKPTLYATKILAHFKIDCFFNFIGGSNMDGTKTRKAEVIETVFAAAPGINKRETVMIGDRCHDVHGANAHDIDSIAVLYGYGSLSELESARPSYLANTVSELTQILLPKK